jgi:hypothetical protein
MPGSPFIATRYEQDVAERQLIKILLAVDSHLAHEHGKAFMGGG